MMSSFGCRRRVGSSPHSPVPSYPYRPTSPEGSQVNIMGVHTVPGSPNTLHRTVATNTPPSPALQRRLGQASPLQARHPPPAGFPSSPLIGRSPKTAAVAGVPPSPLMGQRSPSSGHGTPDELGAASRQGSAPTPSEPAFPVSPQLPEKRHMSSGDAERTDNKNLLPASGGSTPNLSGAHALPDVSKSIYGDTKTHDMAVRLSECLCPLQLISSLSLWSKQMVIQTLRWTSSSSRTPPSSGTSQTSPESRVRVGDIKQTGALSVFIVLEKRLNAFIFFLHFPLCHPHFGCPPVISLSHHPVSSSSFLLPLVTPSLSHHRVEGQGAGGVRHQGQPLLQRSLRSGHEGGLPATDQPTEQKRLKTNSTFNMKQNIRFVREELIFLTFSSWWNE